MGSEEERDMGEQVSGRRPLLCRLGFHRDRVGGMKAHVYIGNEEKPFRCARCGRRSEGEPWQGLGAYPPRDWR